MSLKIFHIFFVSVCFALGALLIYLYQQNQNTLLLGTGLLLIIALIPYSFWFLKKTKSFQAILLAIGYSIGSSCFKTLEACPMCYTNTNFDGSATIQATKIGIIFLGLIISTVLGGIGFTAWSWSKRSKQITADAA